MMDKRAKLYANRIAKRAITILDVPEAHREATMALLSESDRKRQQEIMEGR